MDAVEVAVVEPVVEAPPEGTAPELKEEDVPTSWMNVDLSDLPAPARQGIIDEFKGQESYIGKLQAKLKETAEPQVATPTQFTEPAAAPSDEDILAAYGYVPDGANYEMAKELMLPVLKQSLMLAGQVDLMNQQLEASQAWDNWNTGMDSMEAQYGELPVDRDAVVEFAVAQGIQDPELAYYRLAMQAQKMTVDAAQKTRIQRIEELRDAKRGVSGVRPTTSRPPTQGAPLEASGNLAEDIKKAAAQSAQELGVSWDDAAASFLNRS